MPMAMKRLSSRCFERIVKLKMHGGTYAYPRDPLSAGRCSSVSVWTPDSSVRQSSGGGGKAIGHSPIDLNISYNHTLILSA